MPEEPEETSPRPAPSSGAGNKAAAVVLGSLVTPIPLVLVFFVPAFKKLFEETGIPLPRFAELVLTLGELVSDFFFLVFPMTVGLLAAVIVLTFLLPELNQRKEWGHALRIGVFGALAAWAFLILGLALPLVELIDKL